MAFHRESGSGGKRGGQRFDGSRKPFRPGKSFGGKFGGGKPMMHSAMCTDCGSRCQVPFKPNGSRPVLCNSCFGNSGRSDDKPKRFVEENANVGDMLKKINDKLDLIIQSLND